MTAAPLPVSSTPVAPGISLAASLFHETSSLARAPSDTAYADCLLILAFQHLYAGLGADTDDGALKDCAESIEACSFLSEAVRAHVGQALRDVTKGAIPVSLALNIVSGATLRHRHQMMIDAIGAIGSEGLGNLADTLADAIDGLAEAVKKARN